MQNPDTYNRVKHIESPIRIITLKTCYNIALIVAIMSIISVFLDMIAPLICAIITAICVLIIIISHKAIHSSKRNCLYCHNLLNHVTRTMILSPQYLAMQGIKKGEFYYAPCQWGKRHSPSGWAKISHRAIACHHCRISEEGYTALYEPVSNEELELIKRHKR